MALKYNYRVTGKYPAAYCWVCGEDSHHGSPSAEQADSGDTAGHCWRCGCDVVAYWATTYEKVPLTWAELEAERTRLGAAITAARAKLAA
jgi:hypothetical protein